VPAVWIRAVMHVESLGNVHALSPERAMGLIQIMPETRTISRARYGLGANAYDRHDKILAGTAYLRALPDQCGAPGFPAAYNAGVACSEDHLAGGRSLPAKTRAYVAALAPMIASARVADATFVAVTARSRTESPRFALPAEKTPTDVPPASGLRPSRTLTDGGVKELTALALRSEDLCAPTLRRNSQQ
jgi:hypothetical protein